MKSNRKSWAVLALVALFAANLGNLHTAFAQDTANAQPEACVFFNAETADDNAQVDDHQDGETNDDNAQADNQQDGETNDDAANAQVDDHQDGEVNDDNAQVDDHADGEANDDNAQADNQQDGETNDDAADPEATDTPEGAAYVGSIVVNETALNGLTDAAECAALTAQATVTPEAARAAAETETGAVATKVELDVEDTYLIYIVEMPDGSEVKVDAGNSHILVVEAPDTTADTEQN